ncbi:hypothetical protein PSCLAVI8L_40001 [Pseudoclavibacter sp. 8L]|nr:hypothetical protein PSCLAVI8L_40001 [Pseudoclavibacter sp. 8L]
MVTHILTEVFASLKPSNVHNVPGQYS